MADKDVDSPMTPSGDSRTANFKISIRNRSSRNSEAVCLISPWSPESFTYDPKLMDHNLWSINYENELLIET